MSEHTELLGARAKQLGVEDIWKHFINQYPEFEFWSGSHGPALHHYGKGGLSRHVREIVEVGLHIIPELNLCSKIDPTEFYLAALFHDTGKMYDYEPLDDNYTNWKPVEHRRLIHHLPRSAIVWHDAIKHNWEEYPDRYERYHDSVLHAILAHHGRREAGSPVAPKTRTAWLLHLCDGISARMDDAETLDIVRPNP